MHSFFLCYQKGSHSFPIGRRSSNIADEILQYTLMIRTAAKGTHQAQTGKGTSMDVYMPRADSEGSLFSKALFVAQSCSLVVMQGIASYACLLSPMGQKKRPLVKRTVYVKLQESEIVVCLFRGFYTGQLFFPQFPCVKSTIVLKNFLRKKML